MAATAARLRHARANRGASRGRDPGIHLLRREFIASAAGAAMWPLAARAQSERVRRIGVLTASASASLNTSSFAVFTDELQKLGWSEPQNLRIDKRVSTTAAERQAAVAELIALAPDVIYSVNSLNLQAVGQQTHSIPIVFARVTDPLQTGLVASLAHPGGNVTGFTNFELSMGGKWLGLLKEVAPNVTRVLVVVDRGNPGGAATLRSVQSAAGSFGLQIVAGDARDLARSDDAAAIFAREPNGGMLMHSSALPRLDPDALAAVASHYRLPSICANRSFAAAGGLISYAIDDHDQDRQVARYVDKILRGAKPADLPIQQPTKFELVINLKTAKALGLTVPQSLLATADEVIE